MDKEILLKAHTGFYNVPLFHYSCELIAGKSTLNELIERFLTNIANQDIGNEIWDATAMRLMSDSILFEEPNVVNECLIAGICVYSKSRLFLEWADYENTKEIARICDLLAKFWQRLQIDYNRALKRGNMDKVLLKINEIRRYEKKFSQLINSYKPIFLK